MIFCSSRTQDGASLVTGWTPPLPISTVDHRKGRAVSWSSSGGASAHQTGLQRRLLHVRLYLDTSGVDLINIYQFPWTGSDPQCVLKGGQNFCQAFLRGTWSSWQVTSILAGDFNTSLPRTPHCVGLQDFQGTHGRSTGTQHPDATTLADLLQRRGLLAINTWDTQLRPTYQGGPGHQSRIDFVMVRHKSSDSITKKPSTWLTFQLDLDTPRITFLSCSTSPTSGGRGSRQNMGSAKRNRSCFRSAGNFKVLNGVTGAITLGVKFTPCRANHRIWRRMVDLRRRLPAGEV